MELGAHDLGDVVARFLLDHELVDAVAQAHVLSRYFRISAFVVTTPWPGTTLSKSSWSAESSV